MSFSLPPELEQFVQECVQSGLYGSASEVVHDAFRLLGEKVIAERSRLVAELNQFINEGLEDAAQGRLISGDEAYARSIAKMERYWKKQA